MDDLTERGLLYEAILYTEDRWRHFEKRAKAGRSVPDDMVEWVEEWRRRGGTYRDADAVKELFLRKVAMPKFGATREPELPLLSHAIHLSRRNSGERQTLRLYRRRKKQIASGKLPVINWTPPQPPITQYKLAPTRTRQVVTLGLQTLFVMIGLIFLAWLLYIRFTQLG
jgi:hypothetical protein